MSYKKILQLFTEHELEYAVIGTWALKYLYPDRMNDYHPKDCDLLIPGSFEQIRRFIILLENEKWQILLWERPISSDVPPSELPGKFYIRAVREDLQLDLTYENDHFSWEEILRKSTLTKGIRTASLKQILFLKSLKENSEEDLILKRFSENRF